MKYIDDTNGQNKGAKGKVLNLNKLFVMNALHHRIGCTVRRGFLVNTLQLLIAFFFVLIVASTNSTLAALPDNLTAYWKLDESSGDRIDSVNGFHLAEVDVLWDPCTGPYTVGGSVGSAAGMISSAGAFACTQSELRYDSTSLAAGGSFSVAFWYYATNISTTTFASHADDWVDVTWDIGNTWNGSAWDLAFNVWDDSFNTKSVFTSQPNSANTWHFICVRYDSSQNFIGISVDDGTEATEDTTCFTPNTWDVPFRIGVFMPGRIDEFGYWERAITNSERTYLYNSGSGRTFNPGTGQFQ